jgi:hypothetical protein
VGLDPRRAVYLVIKGSKEHAEWVERAMDPLRRGE